MLRMQEMAFPGFNFQKFPLVQWTNGHIEMSIGHLNVQSSNGRMDMSNASITCKHISAWVPHLELIHNQRSHNLRKFPQIFAVSMRVVLGIMRILCIPFKILLFG